MALNIARTAFQSPDSGKRPGFGRPPCCLVRIASSAAAFLVVHSLEISSPPPISLRSLLMADLEDFALAHRPHGRLIADAGALTPNGYRLTVAFPCGVTFERWITPEEAARDLVMLARFN
jgi:hypothetical protein